MRTSRTMLTAAIAASFYCPPLTIIDEGWHFKSSKSKRKYRHSTEAIGTYEKRINRRRAANKVAKKSRKLNRGK